MQTKVLAKTLFDTDVVVFSFIRFEIFFEFRQDYARRIYSIFRFFRTVQRDDSTFIYNYV
jgi:hypothetical protein